jgi:DNA processing protein
VEPGDIAATRLARQVGAEAALHSLDAGTTLGRRLAPRLGDLDVVRDLAVAARLKARILIPGDDEWPTGLDDLVAPPWCLWVRGPLMLAEACVRSVAVVGARAATPYGTRQAVELGSGLAERGFTVVSGAAYGIDGAAHRGALTAEGDTVAFTAGGIDRPYPRGHQDLYARLFAEGLVVSEVPPGWAPTRSRFIARNRLIATASQGTVVVEAGLRSGSLNTAGTAAEHHRVVGAMPGSVESAVSAGCHELIRRGAAVLVTDTDEVIELVGPMGELAEPRRGPTRLGDDLDSVQAAVHAALRFRAGLDPTEVARRSGRAVAEVLSSLGQLESHGLVRRTASGWCKAPQGRG